MTQVLVDEKSSLTVIEPPVAQSTKWSCCHVIRDEFRLKNFCFDFDSEKVFYSCQWRLPRLLFVILRVCLAIYIGIICLMTISSYFPHQNPHRPWLSFLTNWSFLLFTCHEIVAATIAVIHVKDSTTGSCCMEVDDNENEDNDAVGAVTENTRVAGRRKSVRQKSGGSLPCHIKFSWLLFCVASPMAIIATILANTLGMAELPPGYHTTFKDFNNHLLSGVIALLEVCITAIPVRLLHIVYVVLFISIYFLFNFIVWTFDHTGNVIYPSMDWDNPESAILGWVFIALISAPIIHIFLFVVYRLRLFIYSKIFANTRGDYVKMEG